MKFFEFSGEDYQHTFDSHAFMWLYTNNATVTDAFNDFCNVHFHYSIENGRMIENIFYGVYFLCFLIYLIFSISFLVYVSKDLTFATAQFKLFQNTISKNYIGKFYYKLSTTVSRNQLAVKTEYSKLFNPRVMVMSMSIFIVSFTMISAGLFLQEMLSNGLYSRQTYVTMKDSNDVAYHLQDVMFASTEVYMHKAFNSTYFNDPPLQTSAHISLFNKGR